MVADRPDPDLDAFVLEHHAARPMTSSPIRPI
jgi:hypothetical protein